MKFKEFMMLQLFAEDTGGGSDDDPGSGGTDPDTGGGSDDDDQEGDDPDDDDDPDGEKKYTVKEVDELIKRKKVEWAKTRKKEDDEAKKFAKMNAQEKAEYKQQQLEKRIQELEDEKTLAGMRDEARKQLSEKGINISDNLLEFMVSKDQVIKEMPGLKNIQTSAVALAVSLVLCPVSVVIACQYLNIVITWYYIFASFIAAFIVYLVATGGWEKVSEMWNRTNYKKNN